MAHADFVHLRLHTAYSLSEGAIHIRDLAALCQRHDMPACAVTDTNNLFGALEFSTTLADAGVQPIIGCSLGLGIDDDQGNGNGPPAPPAAIGLLVQNEEGYRNLLKLVSRAHLQTTGNERPQVCLDDLAELNGGLIALTGGAPGPLGRLLLQGREVRARELFDRLTELFPGRLYVEIMRHGLAEEAATEDAFLDFAYDADVPLLATNDVYFSDAEMFEAHDALLCIAEGAYVSQGDRRRLSPEHRFKTAAEMKALFADLPEAVANTLVVARRCAYMAPLRDPILPRYAEGAESSAGSEAEILAAQARDGLEARLAAQVWTPEMDETAREAAARPYRERLEHELAIINQMGFPGYFLIVADFIRWAKGNGVPVGPGRGSGAGSVVAWALTITELDPLRFGLLFERFLNPERVSMPDFDIDFCQDKRDLVIRYVQDKYGAAQVAQIITFGKLQARAVMRDVGRVLEMPYGQVDRLCKMVPNNPANPVTLAQAIAGEPRLRYERDHDPAVARMLDIALKLEGLYRHASTHAAGVVIGDRPLDELVPLYRDPRSDMPVTQFNMKWVEKAGLVKFDFLGLKTLTIIDRACALVRRRGIEVDIAHLPLDDARTFELLGRGDSVGVFQLEGSGMRDVLRKLKPDSFEDIIALVALYRPGPMDNIPTYIKRKHGEETPDYLHESLTDILKETYGVIIYQEQVMQIAQVLAGYSLGEADLLRRAMGKKIASEMDAQRERFVSGATERGVERGQASFIFDLVAKFAGYGFNKSHAAAYALVAYQTAWLKAHYPVEFMAASMTLDLGNTDRLAIFRAELERLGIRLLPPDINRSEPDFAVEEVQDGEGAPVLAVRYALAAIKNVGRHAMEAVVATRASGGPFRDIFDFAERIDPRVINKRQIENLVKAGAFDALCRNRARVFANIEQLLGHAAARAAERESRQVSLFGEATVSDRPSLPETPDWTPIERLEYEFEAIGFYLTGHPLDGFARALEQERIVPSAELAERLAKGGSRYRLAGVISRIQERKSARGNPFAFVEMSDPSGRFEVTVFSEVLSAARSFLEVNRMVVVSVDARLEEGDTPRLIAQGMRPLDEVVANAGTGLSIRVDDAAPLPAIRDILDRNKGRKGLVSLVLVLDAGAREVEIALPERYAITPRVLDAVQAIPGVIEAHEV